MPTPRSKQPPELQLNSPQSEPVELSPLPTDEPIELTIKSTTRPQAGRKTVRNKIAKPTIGAQELVKTPAFGSVRLITDATNE